MNKTLRNFYYYLNGHFPNPKCSQCSVVPPHLVHFAALDAAVSTLLILHKFIFLHNFTFLSDKGVHTTNKRPKYANFLPESQPQCSLKKVQKKNDGDFFSSTHAPAYMELSVLSMYVMSAFSFLNFIHSRYLEIQGVRCGCGKF